MRQRKDARPGKPDDGSHPGHPPTPDEKLRTLLKEKIAASGPLLAWRDMSRRGRYERAGEGAPSIQRDRFQFLLAVEDCEPRVLADLKARVFPQYTSERDRYADLLRPIAFGRPRGVPDAASADAYLADELSTMKPPARKDLVPLHTALWKWAQQWNLTDDWCLKAALHAMADCSTGKTARLTWGMSSTWFRPAAPARSFRFERAGWEPTREGRPEYERATRAEFEERLREDLDCRERRACDQGFSLARTKREAAHFEWLARHRVRGESWAAIRESAPHVTTAKAVEVAARALARRIGLSLRRASRGRPRKDTRAPRYR